MSTIVLTFRGEPFALDEVEARLLCDHVPAEAWIKGELSHALDGITGDDQTRPGPTLRDFDPDRGFILAAVASIRASGRELPDGLRRLSALLQPEDPL